MFFPPARRSRRKGRSGAVVVIALAAGVAVVAAAVGLLALQDRGTIAARTTIGDVDVGGMSRAEASSAVILAARREVSRPIRLIGPRGETKVTGRELGARPLVALALDEAIAPTAWTRLMRRLGLGDTRAIPLTYRLGPVRAAELANRLDDSFGEAPKNADLEITSDGSSVAVTAPAPGTVVDRAALREGLSTLPDELGVPLGTRTPSIGLVEAAVARARVARLLEQPREVRFRGESAQLPVATLAGLVTTQPDRGELRVILDPTGLRKALLNQLGRFERAPTNARFATSGGTVRLVPAGVGKQLDGERIGASLVGNLAARAHRARFTVAAPTFSTEAARKLRIRELVSEFTTYYPCCAPRVTNIKRAAELLDGTIVLPGKEFSLNGALGERTEEKGFVSAPQIFNGRFEDAVGGGISQVATTLFNAAFFSGIKLVEHRAHQFYISRYPMGREATISWGGPELIFRNDWPAAILMDVEATDSGISVRFFSSKLGRRVTTTTGEPYLPTTPDTVTVTNPALPAGTRKVVQEAGDGGFTIDFTRKVFRDGKLIRNELYRQRYDAEDEIVEVGS
jgi:vancomycin resistance protein YoaR